MALDRFETPVRYDTPGSPIIRMQGVTKIFKTAAGDTPVLKDIDIELLQGQFVSVVGRSGSGKSTLANMITGIDRPTTGSVVVGGQPIHKMPESVMAVWRGKNLGIVFQFFQLLPMLSLVENVMLPMDFCNIYAPASREERALSLLRRVGLEGLEDKLPEAVASGQQQCAAVARALANDPPILIADEPTGNLDSNTAGRVMELFEELAGQGKTILFVTHDRTLALRTERMLLISDGELVNEWLAAAFPEAPHPDLLQLSKQSFPVHLAPGAPLPPSTAPGGAVSRDAVSRDAVYLLGRGEMISEENGANVVCRQSGCLIDPLALRAAPRAGAQGAELLALPREGMQPLLSAIPQPPTAPPSAAGKGRASRLGWLHRRRAR